MFVLSPWDVQTYKKLLIPKSQDTRMKRGFNCCSPLTYCSLGWMRNYWWQSQSQKVICVINCMDKHWVLSDYQSYLQAHWYLCMLLQNNELLQRDLQINKSWSFFPLFLFLNNNEKNYLVAFLKLEIFRILITNKKHQRPALPSSERQMPGCLIKYVWSYTFYSERTTSDFCK